MSKINIVCHFRHFPNNPRMFYVVSLIPIDCTLIIICFSFLNFNFLLIYFSQIMLPWIQCVLSYECIEPSGSKATGCDFHREPHFLYSGCHWYEMSAFNIILGLAYNMNTSHYIINFPSILEMPGLKNSTLTQESYLNHAF